MKMITAIINKKDSGKVCGALTEKSFYFTKLASSGGFLSSGNVTLLIGTEDEKVEQVLEILRGLCFRRTEMVPSTVHFDTEAFSYPLEVVVGGATVFVTNVERFEKI